jgi:hypothetical protein
MSRELFSEVFGESSHCFSGGFTAESVFKPVNDEATL